MALNTVLLLPGHRELILERGRVASNTQCHQEPEQWLASVAAGTKTLVQIAAHKPADVAWLPDGCLLRFTDQSLYAGRTIQTGGWTFQLSLPCSKVAVLSRFQRVRL